MSMRLLLLLFLIIWITLPGFAQVKEPSPEIMEHIQQLDRWVDSLPKDKRPSDADLRAAVDYQNVKSAIQFLQAHGNLAAAKALKGMLESNDLYSYGESEGQTSNLSNAVSVRPGVVNPFNDDLSAQEFRDKYHSEPVRETRYTVLDPEKHRQQLVDLAATLYHEWIHTTQNRAYRGLQGSRNLLSPNGNWAEIEAWDGTIAELQRWVSEASAQIRTEKDPKKKLALMQEVSDIYSVLLSMVKSYIGNSVYWPRSSRAGLISEWEAILKQLQTQHLLLKKTIEERSGSAPAPPDDDLSYLPRQMVTPSPEPRFYVPKQSELMVTLQGQGRAAGHVFDLEVSNRSQHPLRFEIPLGLDLQPSDGAQQTMIVGESVPISVAPGESLRVEIPGFCLDPKKDVPKAGPPVPLTNSLVNGTPQPGEFWTFPEPSEELSRMADIIEAGNELSQQDAYSHLFTPQKTRETVIQRALWYARTENTPDEMGKQKLLTDLQEQLQAAGKNPDPEVVEKGADSLWNDVDLTLKKAKSKTAK